MSSHTVIVTKENFVDEVINSDKLVLIDFYADWCGPCKSLAPTLEKYAEDHQADLKVVKINVDNDPELASAFGIKSIPTLMVMKNDLVVGKVSGNLPASALDQFIAHGKKNLAEYLKQKPNALDKDNKTPPAKGLNDNNNKKNNNNKPPKAGM